MGWFGWGWQRMRTLLSSSLWVVTWWMLRSWRLVTHRLASCGHRGVGITFFERSCIYGEEGRRLELWCFGEDRGILRVRGVVEASAGNATVMWVAGIARWSLPACKNRKANRKDTDRLCQQRLPAQIGPCKKQKGKCAFCFSTGS